MDHGLIDSWPVRNQKGKYTPHSRETHAMQRRWQRPAKRGEGLGRRGAGGMPGVGEKKEKEEKKKWGFFFEGCKGRGGSNNTKKIRVPLPAIAQKGRDALRAGFFLCC